MNPQDFLDKRVIDGDDFFQSVAVTATVRTLIIDARTRTGKKGYLVAICQNTSGAASDVTYEIIHNGGPADVYGRTSVSLSDPSLWCYLPYPVALAENAQLQVYATTATANATVTVRLIVYYTER